MSLALTLLQQAPSPEQVKQQLEYLIHPILRHGRDNISFLYSLDAFDWAVIILYFTILALLAIMGVYRVRMVYQFWRYRHIKPQPKRRFAESELPRITVQLPLFNEMYVEERKLNGDARQLAFGETAFGLRITVQLPLFNEMYVVEERKLNG